MRRATWLLALALGCDAPPEDPVVAPAASSAAPVPSAPASAEIRVPPDLPDELAPRWPAVAALAAGDLTGAEIDYEKDHPAVQAPAVFFHASGAGPKELAALAERVRKLRRDVGSALGDPKIGVLLFYKGNARHASSLSATRVGAYDLLLDAVDELHYEVEAKAVSTMSYGHENPAHTVCEGKVTAKEGAAKGPVVVQCNAWIAGQAMGEGPTKSANDDLGELLPGKTKKFRIDLGRLKYEPMRVTAEITVGGTQAPYRNPATYADAEDFIRKMDEAIAMTGYTPERLGDYPRDAVDLKQEHYDPSLDVNDAWGRLDAAAKDALAQKLWDIFFPHDQAHHAGKMYSVEIRVGGKVAFHIKHGTLVPWE